MAQYLTWRVDERGRLVDVAGAITAYAARYAVSERTAWTDLRRLLDAGLAVQTQTPANRAQTPAEGGRWLAQGPGSGRAAAYALTLPVDELEPTEPAQAAPAAPRRRARSEHTSDDTSLTREGKTPPSPRRSRTTRRGSAGRGKPALTLQERREAAAVLTGCREAWQQQRRSDEMLRRHQADALLPLIADALRRLDRDDVLCLVSDRVKSARSFYGVLRHRLLTAITAHPVRPVRAVTPPTAADEVSAGQPSCEAAAAAAAAQAEINAAGKARALAQLRGRHRVHRLAG